MEIRKRTKKYVPRRQTPTGRPSRPSGQASQNHSDMKLFNQLIGACAIIILSLLVNMTGGNFEEGLSSSLKQHTTLAQINANLTAFTKSIPVIGQFFEDTDTLSVFENIFRKGDEIAEVENSGGSINTSTIVVPNEPEALPEDFSSGFDLEKYKALPNNPEDGGGGTIHSANGEPSVTALGSSFQNFIPKDLELVVMTTLPAYLEGNNPYEKVALSFDKDEELPEIELKTPKLPENVLLTKVSLPIKLTYPLSGTVSSKFGVRTDPFDKKTKFHHGLDLAAPKGTTIKPIASGKVIEVGKNSIYGNYIVVEHSHNIISKYAHCTKIIAKKGDKVKTSTKIATVGSTGSSTGNHVHLEVRYNSKFIDPLLNLTK